MRKGFTLVELSIVLVIIGLLVGGLLVAQSMISAVEVQATVRQIQQFDAGVANFKTKYNTFPGDSPYITTAGDGDGEIDDDGMDGFIRFPTTESGNFWVHLFASGMAQNKSGFTNVVPPEGFDITSSTPNSPKLKLGKNAGIIPASLACASPNNTGPNCYVMGTIADFGGGVFGPQTEIPAKEAAAFDTKIDNGLPGSGIMYSLSCTSAGKYNVSSSSAECVLYLKMHSQTGLEK